MAQASVSLAALDQNADGWITEDEVRPRPAKAADGKDKARGPAASRDFVRRNDRPPFRPAHEVSLMTIRWVAPVLVPFAFGIPASAWAADQAFLTSYDNVLGTSLDLKVGARNQVLSPRGLPRPCSMRWPVSLAF